jgi:hypothetical protein
VTFAPAPLSLETPLVATPQADDRSTGEARFRFAFRLVLAVAVLIDLTAQVLHLVRPGSLPLLVLTVALALPTAVLVARRARRA